MEIAARSMDNEESALRIFGSKFTWGTRLHHRAVVKPIYLGGFIKRLVCKLDGAISGKLQASPSAPRRCGRSFA